MRCLVLWDIDHTLIENSGVSKAIYLAAFEAITNQSASVSPITQGRTDQRIMDDLFNMSGVEKPEWPKIEHALAVAGRAHLEMLRRNGWVLPGVRDCLRALSKVDGVVQGILTGNIRDNAVMKLMAFGLDSLVDLNLGAFGSDHEDRSQLVGIARRRVIERLGVGFSSTDTILVGDTPQDVEAARLGHSRVVAVASGIHSEEELLAAGASIVLPNLVDTSRVVAAVLGVAPSVG